MLLFGCKCVFSLQLRLLVGGAWTGQCRFCVEEWNKHECVLTNKWELRLLLHTKIVELTILVGSPWLLWWVYGSTLWWKDCKWMKHRNETYSDIFKLKHMWTGENAINCLNRNKILCMVGQVIQSAYCALARQLKNVLVDLTWKAVVHQDSEWETKPAMNEKQTGILYWAPHMLSTMPMNYSEIDQWGLCCILQVKQKLFVFWAGHPINRLCVAHAAKTLKWIWKWAEVDGTFLACCGMSRWQFRLIWTRAALLSPVWTDFGLLPYGCN